jgi:histidine triad (HIT) family protein
MADRPHDPDCIFCKIVAGDIPCHKIYEDDHVLSFLDIGPLAEGHTLVIPKGHWVYLTDMPDEVVGACATTAKRVGAAVAEMTGCAGWNLLQNNGKLAGQVVMHVHFHIIPREPDDNLGYRWPAGKLDGAVAKRLKSAITARLS